METQLQPIRRCHTQAGCLCYGKPCRLCCICCPPVYESTASRFMYIVYLFFGTLVMILMLTPQVQEYLVNHFPSYDDTCSFFNVIKKCESLVGYIAVYRVALAFILFFLLLSFVTIGTKSSDSIQGGIQNGYWFFKFLFLVGSCIAIFYIPEEWVQQFVNVFMYIGFTGAFIFILIQLLLLINFSHSWSSNWKKRSENLDNCCPWIWKLLTGICGVFLFVIFIIATFLLFYYYTKAEGCMLNTLFLGLNSSLSVLCMFLSVLPYSARVSGGHFFGFLQSSLISVYVMYLTYCALSSEPLQPNTEQLKSKLKEFYDDEKYLDQKYYCGPTANSNHWLNSILPFVGVVIMFITVIYSSIGTSSWHSAKVFGIRKPKYRWSSRDHAKTDDFEDNESIKVGCNCCNSEIDEMRKYYKYLDLNGGQPVILNDKRVISYSYSLFHFVFSLATCYIMMQLTNWSRPHQTNLYSYNRSWITVWIRMSSSWCCVCFYLSTLLFPCLCPGQLNRKENYKESEVVDKITSV